MESIAMTGSAGLHDRLSGGDQRLQQSIITARGQKTAPIPGPMAS